MSEQDAMCLITAAYSGWFLWLFLQTVDPDVMIVIVITNALFHCFAVYSVLWGLNKHQVV